LSTRRRITNIFVSIRCSLPTWRPSLKS